MIRIIAAYYAKHSAPAYNFAMIASFFYIYFNFHRAPPVLMQDIIIINSFLLLSLLHPNFHLDGASFGLPLFEK